jgi:phosphoglycerate transport regulatory protein PgtC
MRILLPSVLIFTLSGISIDVHADPITVLTSFPKEVTDVYKKAFEQKYPELKIGFLSRNTGAALAVIKEAPDRQRPDVFWASAPDAFERLAREKLLERASEVKNEAVPPTIGGYPMNDPEGRYYGQAVSGYGIMWNKRYLQAHGLPKPAEWSDLTRDIYFGHVAMSSPSRSGTTHLTVETILQGEGWDQGWSQLLQIAGNCAAITERSFGVPDGVNKGQFGIGIVIDFFGLSGKYNGFPVDFAYPKVTAIVPASIGLIAGARNAADGKKFIAFALSRAGQELLLDPKISRIPVLPYGDLFDSVPGGYPNIFGIARRSKVKFDSGLAQLRHAVVSSLFDQTITVLLKELQAATRAIHDAERRLAAKPHAQAEMILRRARALAYAPVLSQAAVTDKDFVAFRAEKNAASAMDKPLSAPEERWRIRAKDNYAKAIELALEAGVLMR